MHDAACAVRGDITVAVETRHATSANIRQEEEVRLRGVAWNKVRDIILYLTRCG